MPISATDLNKAYLAYFGRPADFTGKTHFATLEQADVIQAFDASAESKALYGDNVASKVNAIYNNLFNRDAEPAGLVYWTTLISQGRVTPASAALAILNGAQGTDTTAVTNKLAASEAFVAALNTTPELVGYSGMEAAASARSWLKAVGADAASLTAAIAGVDAAVTAAVAVGGGGVPGATFTLTTALGEQINGTAGNDTINAVLSSVAGSSTLNVGDLIDGKAGTDTLKLIVDTAGAVSLPVGLQVNNVENIAITNGGSLAAAIDASAFVGATNIKQIASAQTVQKLAATTTAAFESIETAGLTVTADAAAASANVALDKVKKNAAGDNVVALTVNADAANTALAAVNVSGNIVQKDTTQAANAVKEVFTATFSATVDNDTVAFDGTGAIALGAGKTAAQAAAAYVAAYNAVGAATWVAVDNGNGTVTFTKKIAGAVAVDVVTGDFVVASAGLGADVTVTAAAPTTQGANAVAAAAAASLALNVTLGKDVQAATVNTAVKTTLTIENAAGSTKNLTSVDASTSAGDITYTSADAQVATIKTGAGKDTVTLATALDATTKAASVSTGAGDDTLNVTAGAAAAVTGGTTVAVDAGEGKDTVNLTVSANTVYDVKAGAGDDTVVITGVVKTTDKIDGGDGVDTVSIAGKATYLADDYIVVNKVLTNFETLKLTGVAVTNLDAAQLAANYTTLDLFAASVVDNVSTQALVANGALTAEAAGYKSAAETGAPGPATVITYAGTLNITDKGLAAAADAIQAHAETVNLTIAGGKANGVLANNATLTGEAKTVTVTLSAGTDTKATATDTSDDTLVASTVTIAQSAAAEGLSALTSLTLSGNGTAVVSTTAAVAAYNLVTVDASALNSVDVKGVAVTGLQYTSYNTKAETIKLGGGLDTVTLNASTYGKVDTIEGLNLVLNAGKTAIDAAKSDVLTITGFGDLLAAGKMTTTQTDLDLALKDAAAYKVGAVDVDVVAFQLGGNTYLFSDKGTAGSVDAADIVVKLTGTADLDALVLALN